MTEIELNERIDALLSENPTQTKLPFNADGTLIGSVFKVGKGDALLCIEFIHNQSRRKRSSAGNGMRNLTCLEMENDLTLEHKAKQPAPRKRYGLQAF